jgi:hypothetical protein
MNRRPWPLFFLAAVGCSSSIDVPTIDPKAVSDKALAQYDTNHDGILDAAELEQCPGLRSLAERLHPGGERRLSREEIQECLEEYRRSQVGLVEVRLKVTFNDQPLRGAAMVLEPESFLGSQIKSARGTTDEYGRTRLQVEGAPLSGCNLGFYRVRICKPDGQGTETLPAQYNTQTRLGAEVGPEMRGALAFPLSSTPDGGNR